MKLTLLSAIFLVLTSNLYAQSPQAIPYQAAARNSSGEVLVSTPVSVRFSIHDATADGSVVYSETHSVTTTAQGMLSVNVGHGTPVTGTFSGINWGTNAKYMQVELDPTGGSSYISMGTQQMMSVPYALHAGSSSSSSQWTTSGSNIHNANTGNVGIGTTTPTARLHVADSSVVFTGPSEVYSVTEPGNPSVSGPGSRMMWYADKAAFRAGEVYSTQWDKDNIGVSSVAMGSSTIASGQGSTALGIGSVASSGAATAIGFNAMASGAFSTALGLSSQANGQSSTAIGFNSTSSGSGSFAVSTMSYESGGSSVANGNSSISIGSNVEASGNYSTAIGNNSTASGINSTALGFSTSALGENATSIGPYAQASGWGAVATQGGSASGDYSLALGPGLAENVRSIAIGNCLASGYYSVALGTSTTASGEYSTVLGQHTTASGDNSTAMGFNSSANGEISTAIGNNTTASGNYSTALGHGSSATGDYSTAIGSLTTASGDISTAMGQVTTASGFASTAMGLSTTASGYSSTSMGNTTIASGSYSTAMGNHVSTNEKNGSYIIGDNSAALWAENDANNQMMMRFAGGYKLYNDTFTTKGLEITPSGSAKYMSNVTATFTDRSLVDKHYVDSVTASGSGSSTGWAASGANIHNTNTGNVGIGTTTPAARLHVADSSVVFTGTTNPWGADTTAGSTPISGTGSRMMWYADKAAFRSGFAMSGEWDYDSVGVLSTVLGAGTATGWCATAISQGVATGSRSTALSTGQAYGDFSTAMSNGTASGTAATAIGWGTTASGNHSIAMVSGSIASGPSSIAIGGYANTNGYSAAFVIGDGSSGATVNATSNNQMTMRFGGGYRLFTNGPMTTGVMLANGSNSWATISDRNKKENFAAVDGEAFLRKIAKFNLTSWNYKGQDPATHRHYGPMAQDFYAAFGTDKYGTIGNDTTISQADMEGVSFIAIQALVKENEALKAKINELYTENKDLKAEIKGMNANIDSRFEKLERKIRLGETAKK